MGLTRAQVASSMIVRIAAASVAESTQPWQHTNTKRSWTSFGCIFYTAVSRASVSLTKCSRSTACKLFSELQPLITVICTENSRESHVHAAEQKTGKKQTIFALGADKERCNLLRRDAPNVHVPDFVNGVSDLRTRLCSSCACSADARDKIIGSKL